MKTIITPKRVLLALVLTASSAVQAQSWGGNFLTSPNVGCGGLSKTVMITASNGCYGGTTTTVTLERSINGGISWDWAGQQLGGGHGTSVTFPSATIYRSGLYRFKISGACGGVTLTPFTSSAINITINATYTSNFKINNSTQESPTVIQTYACNPITMDYVPPALGDNPTVTSYKLVIRETNSSGTPISGGFNSNPTGTWTSGAVPASQNLNTGMVGLMLSSGGYYTIGLTAQTSTCTSAERVALIYVTASVPNPTANFLINGQSPTSCGATLQTYQCPAAPITLTNTSTDAISYKVDLYMNATPNDPCSLYSIKHSTGVVTTFPTDAKNLPGTGGTGTWLQSHTGNAAIILTAYNACGTASTKTLYFKVDPAPSITNTFTTLAVTKPGVTFPAPAPCSGVNVPANTGIEYTDGTTSCTAPYKFPMQHSSVTAPNEVGRLFTDFDLSGITGGSSYTISILTEKWNGSSWDNLNYLGQPENYTGISLVSLAGLVVDNPANPYYEHFLTAPNGGIYRITITVSNVCSSVSNSQIIKLNTALLRTADADAAFEALPASDLFHVYPNPTSSEVAFQVFSQEKDIVSIAVYDMAGNHIQDVVSNAVGTGEAMLFTANLDELTSGMYLYTVTVNDDVHTGKLSKQ